MSIIGYIVIGIIILFVLVVYLLFLLSYIGCSKSYREATQAEATIIEVLDEMKLAVGASHGRTRYRRFQKYKVALYIDGEEYIREADLKNRKLQVGDRATVRYEFNKKGEMELVSEALLKWTREMALGYTGGIIFGIILAILYSKGIIS